MPGKSDGTPKGMWVYVTPENWSFIVKAQRGTGVPREHVVRFLTNLTIHSYREAAEADPEKFEDFMKAVARTYRETAKAN